MKKTILSLIIIQLAVFPSVAFATCTHAVGDVVKMISPMAVAEQMSGYALVKDEFETTEEFNARKKTPNGTMIVEATYSPKYVNYDADNERFLVEVFAWSNVNGRFEDSVPSVSSFDFGNLHAIGLHIEENAIGSYPASNAYGKEVEVVKSILSVHGIFDRKGKKDYSNQETLATENKTWAFDFKASSIYSDGPKRNAGIFLPTPRAQAKILKTDMQIGIEFTPKEPFLFQGEKHLKPTIDRPRDTVIKTSSIVGDIKCAIITDAKGTVLKVVETAY